MDEDNRCSCATLLIPETASGIICIPGHQITPRRLPTDVIRPTAHSRSWRVWVAMTVQRRRQAPAGTVGGRIPWTKIPSESSDYENRIVVCAGPVKSGMIWVDPSGNRKPASVRSDLKHSALDLSFSRRFFPSGERTIFRAASDAPRTAGGSDVEKMKLRARLTSN